MTDFNAGEAGRLAKEFAEDATTLLGDDYNAWMDASQRCRSNARSAAEQLRAAVAEVESLRADNETLVAQRDSWRKVADRLALERDGEKMDAIHKANSLRTRLAEVTGLCEDALTIADDLYSAAMHPEHYRITPKLQRQEERLDQIRAALAKKETL